jgi:hypothetical protein
MPLHLLYALLFWFPNNKSVEPIKIPFQDLSYLNEINQMNEKSYETSNVVVIYTFLECKPCLALAKKLEKEISKAQFASERIIYVNVFNQNTSRILQYLDKTQLSSAYFKLPYTADMEGEYPRISGYDERGKLAWTTSGYGRESLKKIEEYIQ